MPMLRALMSARNIAENLPATAEANVGRRILCILAMLHGAGSQLEKFKHALVRWLAQHILNSR